MFCERCGAPNAHGARFCEKCGHELPVTHKRAEKKSIQLPQLNFEGVKEFFKKAASVLLNKKTVIALSVIIILVIAGWISISFLTDKGTYGEWKAHFLSVYFEEQNETEILMLETGHSETLDGEVYSISRAFDGVSGVVNDEYDNLYYYNDSGAGEIYLIAEDCWEFYFAKDGSAVLYYDEVLEDLYLYRIKDGDRTLIAEGEDYTGYAAISPDGEAVVYAVEEDDNSIVTYLWREGEVSEIEDGDEIYILAVSNKGEYVYAVDDYGYLYTYTDEYGKKKIASNVDEWGEFFFNGDGTEILFTSGDDICLSIDGEEKTVVAEVEHGYLRLLGQTSCYDEKSNVWYDIKSFDGELLEDVDVSLDWTNLYLLDKTGDVTKLLDSVDAIRMTRDGKTLYYLEDYEVKCLSVEDDERYAQVIAEDVINFALSSGDEFLFYIDDEDCLFRALLNGENAEQIAEDVTSVYTGKNDSLAYFLEEDGGYEYTLYELGKNGKIRSIDDEITHVTTFDNYVSYEKEANGGYYDWFLSDWDGDFERIFSEYDYEISYY